MLKLIKNGEVFTPQYEGEKDILIADRRIAMVDENISMGEAYVEVYDATGKYIVPGLIDGHVHITGGGGEGSFHTRTPEIALSDFIHGGITTVIGMLGTDGVGRTMTNLVAKSKGLNEEGITCYCVSGNYHVPIKTLTGSVESDLMFIDEIIGVGEIAISDHRSSEPTIQELKRLASEARIGGMLSGKSGVVILHIGSGSDKLSLLEEVIEGSNIPITQFITTHMNRSEELLLAGESYAKQGGRIDFTTSIIGDDRWSSSKSLRHMLDAGVPIEHITFSSDGQGSLPIFDKGGDYIGLSIGKVTTLYDEVRKAVVVEDVPFEEALKVVTSNVADIFKLEQKGRIKEGKDGDFVILNKTSLKIESVMANGEWLMKDNVMKRKGTFE